MRSFWLGLAACPFIFPLAQMLFFGYTDYRRPADAIVVFGARTYATGKASQALADRVNTACDLYQQGLAPVLVFSGGPGDGDVSEPEAMQALAIARGIPGSAIVCDCMGLNTHATVDHVAELAHARGYRSVMAVSHFYHLPRVKLAFDRAGIEAFTVPARETWPLVQMPKLIAREVPALWEYYLGPLAG
jgi:vancomycin permeability regulator SanA